MKIFLFNPESGFYLGEDFADEAPMEPGTFVIPPDATTIAPPRPGPGQVAVFNTGTRRWEVLDRPTAALPVPIKVNTPVVPTRR